ncbi:MAG: hypothetical protein BGO72_21420 [Burkholderiales bacterium 70-64]|nr:MAG: hypothetical protein BGO72_21420 [Burkholderiales bacterium 70-64]
MTQAEFESWIEFYRRWPFDDRHRYYRPAAFIAASAGAKLEQALDWLQPAEPIDALSAAFGIPVR